MQGEYTDESAYLQRTRLCLRSVYVDPAYSDAPDASGTGRVPPYLTDCGAGVGSGWQLSQSRAPQTVDCACCAASGFSRRARGRGDPRTLASGAPEGTPG